MSRGPRWPWISVILLQILQAASLPFWLVAAGFAVMAFDAPGSTESWQPMAMVSAIWSYPVFLLLAGIVSWVLIAFRKPIAAFVVAIVFSLPAVAVLTIVLFMA